MSVTAVQRGAGPELGQQAVARARGSSVPAPPSLALRLPVKVDSLHVLLAGVRDLGCRVRDVKWVGGGWAAEAAAGISKRLSSQLPVLT